MLSTDQQLQRLKELKELREKYIQLNEKLYNKSEGYNLPVKLILLPLASACASLGILLYVDSVSNTFGSHTNKVGFALFSAFNMIGIKFLNYTYNLFVKPIKDEIDKELLNCLSVNKDISELMNLENTKAQCKSPGFSNQEAPINLAEVNNESTIDLAGAEVVDFSTAAAA